MDKIAIFYHCLLRGPGINEDHAVSLMQLQMNALKESGLAKAADEIHVSVNGSMSEVMLLSCFSPNAVTVFHAHPEGKSELPTLAELSHWLTPGWFVFYHHMKGVTYPGHPVWERWRKCLEKVCVWNWEECVLALKNHHTVGAHWITHDEVCQLPEWVKTKVLGWELSGGPGATTC